MGCWRECGSGWARTGAMERVGQTQNDARRLCEASARKGAMDDDRIGRYGGRARTDIGGPGLAVGGRRGHEGRAPNSFIPGIAMGWCDADRKGHEQWYEVIRHALCEDGDETAMLLENSERPPRRQM